MKAKLLLATFILAATPSLGLAQCFGDHVKEQLTMSCPEGQTFDTESNSCITPTG